MATSGYLLIETRDTWESSETREFQQLAISLARTEPVTLLLVQDGVLSARAGALTGGVAELEKAGVNILADEFSLRERGISGDRMDPRVKAAHLAVVLDQLLEGRKVLWQV